MTMIAEDRRVRRSKKLIVQAFVELVVTKDYAHVTVQDIIDRADVGRSTFYAHFRDKEAVLLSCFDEVESGLAGAPDAGTDAAQSTPARLLLHHAWAHRPVYRAVCASSASGIVQRHLRRVLLPFLDGVLPAVQTGTAAVVAREFYASALIGLLTWWVSDDFSVGPDELADDFQRLVADGIPSLGDRAHGVRGILL
jgi:AcrR family transcriptional regulator